MSARRSVDATTVEEGANWCQAMNEHKEGSPMRKKFKAVKEALGSAEKQTAAAKREGSMMAQKYGTVRLAARSAITTALRFINDVYDSDMIGKSEEQKAELRETTSIEVTTEVVIDSWAIITDADDEVSSHARIALSGVLCTTTKSFDDLVTRAYQLICDRQWDLQNYRAYLMKRSYNWDRHASENSLGLLEQEYYDNDKDYKVHDVADVGGYSPVSDAPCVAKTPTSAVVTAAAAAAGSAANNEDGN